ncbi:MAG: hypothetical protein ACFFCW_13010 [Candidatus Hodarchaeota archaeon]
MNQSRKCLCCGVSRRVKNAEDSNETIDRGKMVDTPPGSQATACCPKDYPETWEALCFPSLLERPFIRNAGLRDSADQNPTC